MNTTTTSMTSVETTHTIGSLSPRGRMAANVTAGLASMLVGLLAAFALMTQTIFAAYAVVAAGALFVAWRQGDEATLATRVAVPVGTLLVGLVSTMLLIAALAEMLGGFLQPAA